MRRCKSVAGWAVAEEKAEGRRALAEGSVVLAAMEASMGPEVVHVVR